MTEQSMIERVACAISGAPFPTARSLSKARSALEAMRDPTLAMAEAGAPFLSDDIFIDKRVAYREAHLAAFQAALSEKP